MCVRACMRESVCIVDTRYVYLVDPDDPKAPKTVLRLGYLRQAPNPPPQPDKRICCLGEETPSAASATSVWPTAPTPPHSLSSLARSLTLSLTAAWLHTPHPTSLTHSAHSLALSHSSPHGPTAPTPPPLHAPSARPPLPLPIRTLSPILTQLPLKPFHLPREISPYPPALANPRDAPFGWDAILPHASSVPTRLLARSLARSLARTHKVCTDIKGGLQRMLHQALACARAYRRSRGVQAAARGGAAPTADIRGRVRLLLPSLARL